MEELFLQRREIKGVSRSCVDCHTTRTPLWRGGPAGPRSLCNACGIRYRKRKRGILGMGKERTRTEKSKRQMLLQRKLNLREEEQAAMLLMALSSGTFRF